MSEGKYHSSWCDRNNGGPECNCEASDPGEGMSERERRIRVLVSAGKLPISAVDTLYLIGVIDVIREDRDRLRRNIPK
jgi:hypothetical protein